MNTTTMETTNEAPPEFPRFWDWEEDGSPIAGTFVRAGTGHTAMGERPFVVLEVEKEERTLWLFNEVLRNLFGREVHRRADRQIAIGERITVWRLGEREGGSGRSYRDFRAEFADGPVVTQAEIFGLPPETTPAESETDSDEEGIPF